MASGKEIRVKISSVKSTQKITRAMEMVAASKMRKAQDRMRRSRPYSEKIASVISHLSQAHPEYQNSFMIERQVKRVGIIIISSDRGLCGSLNINLFRSVLASLREWKRQGIPVDLCVIGNKASTFFKRFKGNIVAQASHLGDSPSIADLIGSVKVMLDKYEDGDIDQLFLAYNEFINTMAQKDRLKQILPIQSEKQDEELKHHWDYIYEPESKSILDGLLIRYIESLVYQGVVENFACEQAARMVAMKSASDNAGEIIQELQLAYNKARQATITRELSEIVAGAAAV
jgi:F-type H+-transporting ATPase subunit gamma